MDGIKFRVINFLALFFSRALIFAIFSKMWKSRNLVQANISTNKVPITYY